MVLGINNINPDRIAVIDNEGNQLTYRHITELADKISSKITKRSLLFILTNNDSASVVWTIAAIISGNVPLILSASIEKNLLENLKKIYAPQYIIEKNKKENPFEIITEFGYGISGTGNPYYELYSELSHLLPTSGSTGSPKLVRHKYENIEASALNISALFRLNEKSRPLLVLPIHYTMGLSVVFSHLKVGATILITDRPMTDPAFWKFLKDEKATSFTGVPFSYEILDKLRFTRMKLPFLTLLTQGGGKMSEDLNLKFVNYCLENNKRWIATYGQSEGTARMAWLPEEYALSKIGSIGIAVPNGHLSLRDTDGKEITESPATGEMCYRGKNVTLGYAYSIEDLNKGDERNGFLATGDIAYRDSDGFYYIKGRMGRFLKIFGNRIGLDECERIIRSQISCECACTGTDERLIVYLTDSDQSSEALNVLIETTHLPANVIEIRTINNLPKNEAGKVIYHKLQKD